jgi:hypothetical protein
LEREALRFASIPTMAHHALPSVIRGYFLTEPEIVRDSSGIELSGFSRPIGDIVTLHEIAMRGRVPR